MTKKRHIQGDQLDDDETVVIRGGVLDAVALRADAQRYHAIYGDYGISVFAARDATVDELAQQAPLVRFEILTLVRVGTCAPPGSGSTRLVGTHGTSPWCSRSSKLAWRGSSPASTSAGSTRTMTTDPIGQVHHGRP